MHCSVRMPRGLHLPLTLSHSGLLHSLPRPNTPEPSPLPISIQKTQGRHFHCTPRPSPHPSIPLLYPQPTPSLLLKTSACPHTPHRPAGHPYIPHVSQEPPGNTPTDPYPPQEPHIPLRLLGGHHKPQTPQEPTHLRCLRAILASLTDIPATPPQYHASEEPHDFSHRPHAPPQAFWLPPTHAKGLLAAPHGPHRPSSYSHALHAPPNRPSRSPSLPQAQPYRTLQQPDLSPQPLPFLHPCNVPATPHTRYVIIPRQPVLLAHVTSQRHVTPAGR